MLLRACCRASSEQETIGRMEAGVAGPSIFFFFFGLLVLQDRVQCSALQRAVKKRTLMETETACTFRNEPN